MSVIRDIMNGSSKGLARLTGKSGIDPAQVPAPNLIHSGLRRLGQKLGRRPDLRIDPPLHVDSETARRNAEKRHRILDAHDKANRLRWQLKQNGVWLAGYGYTVWTITEHTVGGVPYVHYELQDPYLCYPGDAPPWDQPQDCAFVRRLPARTIADRYPDYAKELLGGNRWGGGVLLEPSSYGTPTTWGSAGPTAHNPSGAGVEIVEYYDADGYWCCVPDRNLILEHYPNPLRSGPAFVVMRDFSFDEPQGQYDQALGIQYGLIRLNVLALHAAEDAVYKETIIEGHLNGPYRRGRFAHNVVPPGTNVYKLNNTLDFAVFQQAQRLEQQFRTQVGYSQLDDSQNPANMAATGVGLDRLAAGVDLEVRQRLDVIELGCQLLDFKVLEWEERCYGDEPRPLPDAVGMGRWAEKYRPATDIRGAYQTRRTYGALAGLDDAQRIVAILQLLQARLISAQFAREQLDSLDNLTRIEEQLIAEQSQEFLFSLVTSGQPIDPRVPMLFMELLPEGDIKQVFRKFFSPEEPEMSEEEMLMAQGMLPGQAPAPAALPAVPPDPNSVMARLSSQGSPVLSSQTVM